MEPNRHSREVKPPILTSVMTGDQRCSKVLTIQNSYLSSIGGISN